MLNYLRYSSVVLIYYPLVIAAVWKGGHWPTLYLVGAVAMYLILDNCTAPLLATQSATQARGNDVYLFLHIPYTLLLLAIFLLKIRLMRDASGTLERGSLVISAFHDVREVAGAAIAIGVHLGINNVAAHELMHRSLAFWRGCSRVLLTLTGDPQFLEAHLYGHHAAVGTPSDPATARRGESFYRFLVRSTWGQWREAYRFESFRLRTQSGLTKWVQHRVLRGNLATLLLLAASAAFAGPVGLAAYLLVMFLVKSGLEGANYIQHYALTRDPRSKVEPHHSWDCASRGSSMYMYNLTRHADHHAAPRKPFWELEISATRMCLPHGYMAALMIALVPPLWFRYIDRVLQDDVTKAPAKA